tara:strand:+ start:20 stop:148 length:129 start_codon:yes stop_codon:yes gene_type:complete
MEFLLITLRKLKLIYRRNSKGSLPIANKITGLEFNEWFYENL